MVTIRLVGGNMMKEMMQYIGKHYSIHLGGLAVHVEIIDVKQSYGRTRFLVKPLQGRGEVWVESIYEIKEGK